MVKNYQSTFFEFKNENREGNFSISEFKGWNGSLIIRLDIPKNFTNPLVKANTYREFIKNF